MTQLQVGDKYQVVWNGSEWLVQWTDPAALVTGDIIQIGVDPEVISGIITGTFAIIMDDATSSVPGMVGIGGNITSVTENSILSQTAKQGQQGILYSDLENVLSDIIGTIAGAAPPDVVEGAISSIAGILNSEIYSKTGSVGTCATQLDGVSTEIQGIIGFSGEITTTIYTESSLIGKLGVNGNIVALLEDLGLQLIEIAISDKVYQIVISTKTGQIVLLAPKVGQIEITTQT